MKKPKPKPKPRVRRNPFERALENANQRLERASSEYNRCQARMADLAIEIPKLADMVRSLGGYVEKSLTAIATEAMQEIHHEPLPANPIPRSPMELVPEHLRRFITPHPSTARGTQAQGRAMPSQMAGEDEDAFLKDNFGGVEVLP